MSRHSTGALFGLAPALQATGMDVVSALKAPRTGQLRPGLVRPLTCYGLKPNDPMALTLAAIMLPSAVLAAGYVPARKASRIGPVTALRVD